MSFVDFVLIFLILFALVIATWSVIKKKGQGCGCGCGGCSFEKECGNRKREGNPHVK